MGDYYNVNKIAQANGDHEVHTAGCTDRPRVENRIELGYFTSCVSAVAEAKKHYWQSNGCYWCSRPCHTS
ncbi:hypothetical protein C6A88_34800 [Mycolicibacterium austroafricanum]|nr:hypothetical protein C6A88_34800 [Mycolicibacterium austroafricanum]